MKIAIYQYDMDVGGIQKSLINLLKHLNKDFKVDVFLFSKTDFYNEKFPENVTVSYLKPYPSFFKLIPFRFVYLITKYKSNREYDVSIDFNSYQMETSVYALKTNAKKKMIWCHNDVEIKLMEEKKYRTLWFFFKSKFKYFDVVCAVSQGVKESFHRTTKMDADKIVVLPNYIDTEEIIEKSMQSAEIEVDPNKYNLVTVGRITHQKGLDILLDIYSQVLLKRHDFHLYIIGDGEELSAIESLAKKLNIQSYISFLGKKVNPFSYLKMMDGFILTSRYEGQGMVLLEAKCLGLDLFFSKHLEKYLSDFKGQSDIVSALLKAKKNKIKKIDTLKEYNAEILSIFSELCSFEDV